MKFKNVSSFILAILVIALLGFTAIKGINIGNIKLSPAGEQINQGLDLKGGVFVVYEAKTDAKGEELNKIINLHPES